VGDRLTISGRMDIVRDVELLLGEHELCLVVQLIRDELPRPSTGEANCPRNLSPS
jgi:hypothetical protein